MTQTNVKLTQQLVEMQPMLEKVNIGTWLQIDTTDCDICISCRPSYCDRGRYGFLCDTKNGNRFSIDEADAFPRYFFNVKAMLLELQSWCEFRNQEINWFQLQSMNNAGNVYGVENDRAVPAMTRSAV